LRLGCVRLRRHVVIEAINGRAIGARDQVAVRVDRDLDAAVLDRALHHLAVAVILGDL
jgi:hypothetical protein